MWKKLWSKFEEFAKRTDCSQAPSVRVNYSPYDLANAYINNYNKWVKRGNKLGLFIFIFDIISFLAASLNSGKLQLGLILLTLFFLVFIHICVVFCVIFLGKKDEIKLLKLGNFKICDTVISNHSTVDDYDYDAGVYIHSTNCKVLHFRDTNLKYYLAHFVGHPIGMPVVLLIVNKRLNPLKNNYSEVILKVYKKGDDYYV